MPLRRSLLGAGLAGAAFASAATRAFAQSTTWQFATPYPDGNFHTRNIRGFLEDVAKAANGRLAVTLHTNASLLKMPEIKRGVQSGQVQLGEILLSAYGNEDPMFEVDGIPQLVSTAAEAKVLADLQRPFVEARFQRQGMTLLYMVPWPPSGFYTNTPVASIEDLKGTRMRTFSAATNRFATLVGATPTLVQAAEIPQAFATGVVNAMVTSGSTGVDTQAWDYAKHYVPVGFTRTKNAVFVSSRALGALPADLQTAIREAARVAETRGYEASEREGTTTQATLASRGITVTSPAPEALMAGMAKVGEAMTAEWLAKAGDDGKALIEAYKAKR